MSGCIDWRDCNSAGMHMYIRVAAEHVDMQGLALRVSLVAFTSKRNLL